MKAIEEGTVEPLPSIRFVDRFRTDDDVFYAESRENGVQLYRVTGTTENARALVNHDAVIHNDWIVSAEYESMYGTIDLYHHRSGRKASIAAPKHLEEPVVTLEEVPRV